MSAGGSVLVSAEAVGSLEPLRLALGGRAMTIVSGERAPSYNAKVRGAKSSRHLPPAARASAALRREMSAAADIRVAGLTPKYIAQVAEQFMRVGLMAPGGIGVYDTFVHIDDRGRIVRFR